MLLTRAVSSARLAGCSVCGRVRESGRGSGVRTQILDCQGCCQAPERPHSVSERCSCMYHDPSRLSAIAPSSVASPPPPPPFPHAPAFVLTQQCRGMTEVALHAGARYPRPSEQRPHGSADIQLCATLGCCAAKEATCCPSCCNNYHACHSIEKNSNGAASVWNKTVAAVMLLD